MEETSDTSIASCESIWDQAADDLREYFRIMDIINAKEKASNDRMFRILTKIKGKKWVKDLKELLEDCECCGMLRLSRRPTGRRQPEDFGKIKEMWVTQYVSNQEGDSHHGTIWVKITEGRYLESPFST